MKLYIKYMISLRCKTIVKAELEKWGIKYSQLEIGSVELSHPISRKNRTQLRNELLKSGLEILDDNKSILIERIKQVVVEMVHYADEMPKKKLSVVLSEKLQLNYTYLANIFSEVQGITIQQFIINHKIERVKAYILYEDLGLKNIASRLNYSSVGHLSNQFKKVTGLTPSFFKKLKKLKESSLIL